MSKGNAAIIGAGAWGTALATVMAENAEQITIIGRNEDIVEEINSLSTNSSYLPGVKLPNNVVASLDFTDALEAEILLIVLPFASIRQTLAKLSTNQSNIRSIVLCSKGIEIETLQFGSQIAKEYFPSNMVGALAGPNIAIEVATNKPAIATLALSQENQLKYEILDLLSTRKYQVELSYDLIGVEVFGAAKNSVAIGAGILQALDVGYNSLSSFFYKSVQEVNKLSLLLGGRKKTTSSAAALGDLFLSCGSKASRNTKFGYNLVHEKASPGELLAKTETTIEGYGNSLALQKLVRAQGFNSPLLETIGDIVEGSKEPEVLIELL